LGARYDAGFAGGYPFRTTKDASDSTAGKRVIRRVSDDFFPFARVEHPPEGRNAHDPAMIFIDTSAARVIHRAIHPNEL
jgi:hypothetical protein